MSALDGSDRGDRSNTEDNADDRHAAYHDYYGAQSLNYGPSNEGQVVGLRHENISNKAEQTHQESFHEEGVTRSIRSSLTEKKRFPDTNANGFSLTQTILSVLSKWTEHYRPHHEEDHPGTASLLETPRKSPSSFLAQPTAAPRGNLKTSGLEESDYGVDLEGGGHSTEETEEMAKYLPRSAALLVSSLQSIQKTRKGASITTSESVEDFFSQRSDSWDLEGCEKEAEALLESICQVDVGGLREGVVRETVPNNDTEWNAMREHVPRRSSESERSAVVDMGFETNTRLGIGVNTTDVVVAGDDDEGSIGGDLARLTASVASIRRDLQNIEFSQFEEFGGGCITDDYEGGNSLLARFKLWMSRGLIMEQKLVHTYVTQDGVNSSDDGTRTSLRYGDNPVLLWSLALMWSFVVLILLHPKFAALIEGGDEGQLADILQRFFGNDEVDWI